jgi:hypothetical protein
MATVIVEVNGRVVETYQRATNKLAFALAWDISQRFGRGLNEKGYFEIVVVTQDVRIGKQGALVQMDGQGNILETFDSARQAERVTGINHHTILKATRRENDQAGGYRWQRVG